MRAYWQFAKKMLRHKATVAWALLFAVLTAGGLGAGLMSLGPMLEVILEGETLVNLARRHNDKDPALVIPAAVIERLPGTPFGGVVLLIVGIVVITIIGGVANFMHRYLSAALAAGTIARIRQEAFHHVVHLPLHRVIARGPSDFVARIVRDAAELQRGFMALISKAVTQVFKGLAAFVAALVFHAPLTLTATVVAPVLLIVLRKLGKRIRRGSRGSLHAQQGLLRVATETLHGLRAVKANTGERRAAGWFHRINKVALNQELRVRTAKALTAPAVETLAIVAIGGLAILAARHILAGDLPVERFVGAIASLGIAGASFRPVASLINEIQAASAPAQRLADILGEPIEGRAGLRMRNLAAHRVSLRFEDVSFTYPGAQRPALRRINLGIAAGERIALVGPNGSGKTTLVSLLPRLLEPDEGRVVIDDVDVATVNLRSLRHQIAVVTQETVLFRGTVADNIAFGCPGGGDGRERIVEAARRAHADEFIRGLPRGYDTDLSESGASLSGGQRQRLAIARAILRDPSILVLDEATSQIDAESEAHINAALADFCRGRTALLIAHRLSTVLNADRIVVMDRGEIIAEGSHEQLLASCELYRRLTRTQLVSPANDRAR